MSVNKVILLGSLGRDPETRQVGSATVASFSLATEESYKNQQGELVKNTEWHNIEWWNPNGALQYLAKGTQVFIEGSIRTDKWQDQQGQQRSTTKIRALSVQLVGSRPQAQAAPQYAPQGQYPPQYAPQAPAPQYPPQQGYAPQMPPQAPQGNIPQNPYASAPSQQYSPFGDPIPPQQ